MEICNMDSQIFGVVKSLLEAAADKDEQVRSGVASCVRDLAKPYPDEVLQTICTFKNNHPKMTTTHVASLLQIAESICRVMEKSAIDAESTVNPLVSLAVAEMTASLELISDWQLPASQLLVALSRNYCDQVMDGLLTKFQPGVVPHYFVLHTLGSIASANSYAMVPYIKACLGTMLPMMGGLRSDALKQAYAYTLGRFADAIQDYLANLDQAPDPSVTRDVFSSEMNSAIGVIVSSWLGTSKDQQMLDNVLHAIAGMFVLLPSGRCAELAPKLLQALLALKRRSVTPGNSLPLSATRCLAAVLAQLSTDAAGSAAIEPALDHLLVALSDLIYEAPDLEQPLTIKNHYESLRCFDTLANRFPERLSVFLSLQLRANNERERARGLVILAHLVNCGQAERHLPDLATSVRALINDPSTKVRRAVVKVVVVLAHKGYLKDTDGADFILFVVKNCIYRPVNVKAENSMMMEQEELRQVCCDSLVLLSSAAPQVASLLTPLLLQCLLQTEFSSVAGLLAKCLNSINARCITEEVSNTEVTLTTPSSFDILARCLVLLGSPLPDTGTHILGFLQTSPAIQVHENVKPVLSKLTTQMVNQIQDPSWQLSHWQQSLLELVRHLIEGCESTEWRSSLAQALVRQGQQLLDPHERHAQLTSLACLSATSKDHKLAATLVQDALDAARIHHDCEQVCADAIAECACGSGEESEQKHLALALSQLRLTSKDLPAPSHNAVSAASKLLPAFLANIGGADRSRRGEAAAGSERLRCAILLSYGELAVRAPGVELLPKLEPSGVLDWILEQLQSAKEDAVRMAALKSLGQIAASFHPNCNSGLVVLECRQKAITLTMGQTSLAKKEITEVALSVATSLIELHPSLDTDSRMLVLKAGFDKVFSTMTDEVSDTGLVKALERMCNATLLSAGVTPASMDELLTLLEPWLQSSALCKRTTATRLLAAALSCYAKHLQFGFENPSTFSIASEVLCRAVPRCTDISPACRSAAVQCVRLALVIAASYVGRQPSDVEAELDSVFGENSLLSNINTDDSNMLYEATTQLAKVICSYLPPTQMQSLLSGLMKCLMDPEPVSSAGASVVLNEVIKEKGAEMINFTADLVDLIVMFLPEVKSESTHTGVIHCVATLAEHHPKHVTLALMHHPLPYNTSVQSCWQLLARQTQLVGEVCGILLSVLATYPLCEEPRDKASPRVALADPLAAVSALHEMLSGGSEPMTEHANSPAVFPELLSALLLALAGLVGACPPVNIRHRTTRVSSPSLAFVPNRDAYSLVPGRVALDCCRSFLTCTGCIKAADTLSQCNHVETGENITSFIDMVPSLISIIVNCRPQVIPRLVACLNKSATSNVESARITVTAVIAQLVQWPRADAALLNGILQQLTESLDDSSTVVRQLALQGLSYVAKLEPHQRNRYVSSVLVALLGGLEDSPGEGLGLGLAQEALAGLAAILPVINPQQALDIQASLALRIRPFFTKDNGAVRAAAFQTLGELAVCGETNAPQAAFVEQLTSSLVNLLLGLCDTHPPVVQACKKTLRRIAPLLTADKTAAMLKEHLIDNGCLQFPQFTANLVKIMADEMPDQFPYFVMTAMGFTRSQWADTRANAVLLIGFLCGCLPPSQKSHVGVVSVCSRLTQLLTDPSPLVRTNAARAISCVFTVP